MSFNYRKEEYALNKRLEKQRRFFCKYRPMRANCTAK